jgi:hypothetical protein
MKKLIALVIFFVYFSSSPNISAKPVYLGQCDLECWFVAGKFRCIGGDVDPTARCWERWNPTEGIVECFQVNDCPE